MNTILFTPSIDTRYGEGQISSRIGLSAGAIPFDNTFDLFAAVNEALLKDESIRCVLVDEAQFMTRTQVYQLTEIADQLNIPVLAYGLRTDFLGELFEGSRYLLAWADELTEIKTICHCGRKATMVVKIDAQGHPVRAGDQIEIGGNDRYISTCRRHFKLGQVEKKHE